VSTIRRATLSFWFSVWAFTLLTGCPAAFSQPRSQSASEPAAEDGAAPGAFIAALEWSVERSRVFVWPFESLPPSSDDSVWVVIESMPRAWTGGHGEQASRPLAADACVRLNGRSLPEARLSHARQAIRVPLERGRLRFSFSLPSGVRLDSRDTSVRIKLYQANKDPASTRPNPKRR
jgi:hypothetical protein